MFIDTKGLGFPDDGFNLAPGIDLKIGLLALDPEDYKGLATRPCAIWGNTYPDGARILTYLYTLKPAYSGARNICL